MDIQEVICTNVPERCCLDVTIQCPLDAVEGIERITLTRTSLATNHSSTLIDKTVTQFHDLDFTYSDYEVVSGVIYRYTVVMWGSGSTVERQGIGSARCEFVGISVADTVSSWYTNFGTSDSRYSESYKYTRPVQYVNTLIGKYPHRVMNSESNYATGSCSGLWVPVNTGCGDPNWEGDVDGYRQAFIEWLMNGNEKLLRTGSGKAFVVGIDGDISENWDANHNLTTVAFNWTQVGEIDMPKYTNSNPGWVRGVIS